MLPGYRDDGGLMVPEGDYLIARYLRRSLPDLDLAVKHCRNRGIVVQAGGNCGAWPMQLSLMFDAVYTFEPDPVNFTALAFNTVYMRNIVKMQAALGDVRGCIELNRMVKNCGAFYVEGKGLLPTLRIDDLALPGCDLIYLDIEGTEMKALRGAVKTIDAFAPVVAFEDKGLGQRYGVEPGAVATMMHETFGYRVVAQANHDTIMVKA